MLNFQKLNIEYFVKELARAYRRNYSDIEPDFGNLIAWSGRLSLENIANSNALYYEFDEPGINEELGYKRPGDLRKNYPRFYWDVAPPSSRTRCGTYV